MSAVKTVLLVLLIFVLLAPPVGVVADAVSALVNLGYSQPQAAETSTLIRLGLKELSK